MSWSVPITWVAGQVVGASDLNTQLRDNMTYLLQRPLANIFYTSGGNYTIGLQGSLVPVDATNVSMSLTLSGTRIMGMWSVLIGTDSSAHLSEVWLTTCLDTNYGNYELSVYPGTFSLRQGNGPSLAAATVMFTFTTYPGAHSVQLCWRNIGTPSGEVSTIYCNAGGYTQGIRGSAWEY